MQINAVLLEAAAVPTAGVIERLALASRVVAWFAYVDLRITSANCPTVAKPSIEGALLDDRIFGLRVHVLAELRRLGRCSATVAEGLLYALKHPTELKADSCILCLGQVVVIGEDECMLALGVDEDGFWACLESVSDDVEKGERLLYFPMTVEELDARDAEDAVAAQAA